VINRGRAGEHWQMNVGHHHIGGAGHHKPREPELPRDIGERMGQLKMIFEHIDEDTLMVALKHNQFDPNRAADELFDQSRVDMYQREAKQKREEQAAEARLQSQNQQQQQTQQQQQAQQQQHQGQQGQLAPSDDDDDDVRF